jgi:ArsR family transcriptional regulator
LAYRPSTINDKKITAMPLKPVENIHTDEPAPDFTQADFSQICKALGHPTRVKIVQYLREINRCFCRDIVDILPISQSTVSQHLKILKQSGLIQGEVDGSNTCYCIDLEIFNQLKKAINSL